MAKLIFSFNKNELEKAKLTENDILSMVRDYAGKNNISEKDEFIFEGTSSENLMKIGIAVLSRKYAYLQCIESLVLDDGSEMKDLKERQLKWLKDGGFTQINVSLEQAMKIKKHNIPFKIKFGYGDTVFLFIEKKNFYKVHDIIFG